MSLVFGEERHSSIGDVPHVGGGDQIIRTLSDRMMMIKWTIIFINLIGKFINNNFSFYDRYIKRRPNACAVDPMSKE